MSPHERAAQIVPQLRDLVIAQLGSAYEENAGPESPSKLNFEDVGVFVQGITRIMEQAIAAALTEAGQGDGPPAAPVAAEPSKPKTIGCNCADVSAPAFCRVCYGGSCIAMEIEKRLLALAVERTTGPEPQA